MHSSLHRHACTLAGPRRRALALTVASILLVPIGLWACSSRAHSAQQVLSTTTSAVTAATPQGSKYLPQRWAELQSRLTRLNEDFAHRQYDVVLADAPALTQAAQTIERDAAERRDEILKTLTAQWTEMVKSIPPLLASVSNRLGDVSGPSRAHRSADLPAARKDYAEAQAEWNIAETSVAAGNLQDGIGQALQARSSIDRAAAALPP